VHRKGFVFNNQPVTLIIVVIISASGWLLKRKVNNYLH